MIRERLHIVLEATTVIYFRIQVMDRLIGSIALSGNYCQGDKAYATVLQNILQRSITITQPLL